MYLFTISVNPIDNLIYYSINTCLCIIVDILYFNLIALEIMYDFITIVSFTKNASHTFYFSFYLNVEINVDGLASVYEKIT